MIEVEAARRLTHAVLSMDEGYARRYHEDAEFRATIDTIVSVTIPDLIAGLTARCDANAESRRQSLIEIEQGLRAPPWRATMTTRRTTGT